ncbi:MAG: matrixin family metalloprotease [Phycisphaerae bacterium]|nr:matrixin family metalloprotease [Phycisphaerae bacterium]
MRRLYALSFALLVVCVSCARDVEVASYHAGETLPFLERLVDDGRGPVAFCFAPGTDPEVINYYNQLMHTSPDGQRYYLGGRWPGSQGDPCPLTWSFVPDGLSVDGETSELFSRLDAQFGNRATWIAQFEASFARWGELTGMSYTRVTSGGNDWDDGATWGWSGNDTTRGDIRIAMIPIDGSSGTLGYNRFPSNGDMVLDRAEYWASSSGSYRFLRNVVMHEHGHGLGMEHVCSYNSRQLMEPYLDTTFDGPQDDDIRGAQRQYGDAYESDNTTATATNLGTVTVEAPVELGPAPNVGYASLLSIDANNEVDYFRFTINSASSAAVTITPVGRVYDSSPQLESGCDCCNDIDSSAMANLNVSVIDTDGSTVLGTADAEPAGVAETLTDVFLTVAGTYYIRVYERDSPAEPQFYNLSLSITELDCNDNGIMDTCDLDCAAPGCSVPGCGQSQDCNGNSLPDECELEGNDCNNNSIPDDCDIAGVTSVDCQPDGIPDECQIAGNDCQPNQVPDDCELEGNDCQPDGIPDECQIAGNDCQPNGVPDDCEDDCNTNGVPDDCDIASGTSQDCNDNHWPDECDVSRCTLKLWGGFNDFATNIPMDGFDEIPPGGGDGSAWVNPAGNAQIDRRGCETGNLADKVVQVGVPAATGTPPDWYVHSEYLQPHDGQFPSGQRVYSLTFRTRVGLNLNPGIDWQFSVHDGVNDEKVIIVRFSSTVSSVFPGFIVVENPPGTYVNTGLEIELDECYEIEVVLDNDLDEVTVAVSVDGALQVLLTGVESSARRMDYFRVETVDNGSGSSAVATLKLDHFDLCLTGAGVSLDKIPDCNNNGIFDECDLDCNASGVPDDCETITAGDFNADGVIDLADHGGLVDCLAGPEATPNPYIPECVDICLETFDFDADGDVDLADFAEFHRMFNTTPFSIHHVSPQVDYRG